MSNYFVNTNVNLYADANGSYVPAYNSLDSLFLGLTSSTQAAITGFKAPSGATVVDLNAKYAALSGQIPWSSTTFTTEMISTSTGSDLITVFAPITGPGVYDDAGGKYYIYGENGYTIVVFANFLSAPVTQPCNISVAGLNSAYLGITLNLPNISSVNGFPANTVFLTCIGGGGGGGGACVGPDVSSTVAANSGAGGGGGGHSYTSFKAIPGQLYNIGIGEGGTAGKAGDGTQGFNGGHGGDTSVYFTDSNYGNQYMATATGGYGGEGAFYNNTTAVANGGLPGTPNDWSEGAPYGAGGNGGIRIFGRDTVDADSGAQGNGDSPGYTQGYYPGSQNLVLGGGGAGGWVNGASTAYGGLGGGACSNYYCCNYNNATDMSLFNGALNYDANSKDLLAGSGFNGAGGGGAGGWCASSGYTAYDGGNGGSGLVVIAFWSDQT